MEPISIQQSGSNGAKAWNKKEHVDRVLLQNSKNKKIPGRKQNVWNIYFKKLNVVFRFFFFVSEQPSGWGRRAEKRHYTDVDVTEAQQKWTRKIWKDQQEKVWFSIDIVLRQVVQNIFYFHTQTIKTKTVSFTIRIFYKYQNKFHSA